jgi:hypothetical protein
MSTSYSDLLRKLFAKQIFFWRLQFCHILQHSHEFLLMNRFFFLEETFTLLLHQIRVLCPLLYLPHCLIYIKTIPFEKRPFIYPRISVSFIYPLISTSLPLITTKVLVRSQTLSMRFVVDRLTLGHFFHQILLFPL